MISFGSDNHAGVHPEILAAIAAANEGFTPAYGSDPWTERFSEVVRREFGRHAVAYPVFNGTGANVIALSSCLKRFEGVIAVEKAHIDTDETGAPERVGGFKLLTSPSANQKLSLENVRERLQRRGDKHGVQPKVISLTQSTELGTLYTLAELRYFGELARAENLYLHMDGARVANAAVALGCSLKEMTTDVGVDVLSFGGTKNGTLAAEAVIGVSERYVKEFGEDLKYIQKQSLQLASKMRFISAQLLALFEGGAGKELWRRNAAHANVMAKLLESEALRIGAEISQPTEANAVFAKLPLAIVPGLQAKFSFYIWDETVDSKGRVLVRWMTSFQTKEADVRAFSAELARVMVR
jgi:threonine aldolase